MTDFPLPSPVPTLTLTLKSLRFFGRHGVYAEETASGQCFTATVSLVLPAPHPDRRDALEETVDYNAVHAVVRSVLEGPPVKLIETLAEATAAALLRSFPRALEARVEVLKPKPPVDFDFDGVAVAVVRTRLP